MSLARRWLLFGGSALIATSLGLIVHLRAYASNPEKEVRSSEPPRGQDVIRPQAPGEWVLIKAGSFTMGSPRGEPWRDGDETQHRVMLTRDFYLQATEVTQGQWQEMMGNRNPAYFKSCGSQCPVERVSWYDAVVFVNELSSREGLEQCYELSGCSGSTGGGCRQHSTYCNGGFQCQVSFKGLGCRGYRLPTEAEWEYAARAGTTTALYTGPIRILGWGNVPALDPIAWYGGNSKVTYSGGYPCSTLAGTEQSSSRCGTHPVKGRRPNGWGLYDMLGNVWEWTHDWYERDIGAASVTDPVGLPSGQFRVLRGGGWIDGGRNMRVPFRLWREPVLRTGRYGFRVAITATRSSGADRQRRSLRLP